MSQETRADSIILLFFTASGANLIALKLFNKSKNTLLTVHMAVASVLGLTAGLHVTPSPRFFERNGPISRALG